MALHLNLSRFSRYVIVRFAYLLLPFFLSLPLSLCLSLSAALSVFRPPFQNNEVYDWTQEQQGIILSSFFWGYLATQMLGGILSQCYGGKYVFVLGILFSAFCSLLTPYTVRQCKITAS